MDTITPTVTIGQNGFPVATHFAPIITLQGLVEGIMFVGQLFLIFLMSPAGLIIVIGLIIALILRALTELLKR